MSVRVAIPAVAGGTASGRLLVPLDREGLPNDEDN